MNLFQAAAPTCPGPPRSLDDAPGRARPGRGRRHRAQERVPLRPRRVLIIVQNLPVPFDRRVWLECNALRDAGYRVAVVCPKAPGDPPYEEIDSIECYKYELRPSQGSRVSFVLEYLTSFTATLWLTLKAARHGRFSVVQSCNPPDIFWPIGLLLRFLHGTRFVFDHHDLCPELYQSRYPEAAGPILRLLRLLERWTTGVADRVIATNASYRSIEISRDHVDPRRIAVVRTGPDPDRLRRLPADPSLRRNHPHLVAYLGVMGPQDGVDIVLHTAAEIVHGMGRRDIGFVLMGSGDCFDELVSLRDELDLDGVVELTGRVSDATVAAVLSSADLGICPDPKSPLNDVSTMNKTMEYMAFGLPVVAFDLRETRVSAGEAAVYATPNEVGELARLVVELMDDRARRDRMGEAGRRRIETELSWLHQAPRYVAVFDELAKAGPARRRAACEA